MRREWRVERREEKSGGVGEEILIGIRTRAVTSVLDDLKPGTHVAWASDKFSLHFTNL